MGTSPLTSLPPQTLPQICESWLKSYLMQVCKPCHYALIEAVEPCKLHPSSTSYIHKVFESLLRFWMGIWLHILHILTTTASSPDLGKLAEILPDASVQMQTIQLRFDWGCRTLQTAAYVHVIHIWEVWAPFQVVDGHMASHSHRCLHRHSPRLVRVGWNLTWCKCAKRMPLQGCRTFQTASHVHAIHIWGVWATAQVVNGYMASHSHHYLHWHFPRFARVGWNPAWCKCANMPLRFDWGCRTMQTASLVHATHIWGVWAPSQVTDGHMASHSHHYHHRCFPRFVRVRWNPTWCKCANYATTLWLRLQNLSNCIPCPCHTYMRCLSTFSGCGWAYGFTLTQLPPQMLP